MRVILSECGCFKEFIDLYSSQNVITDKLFGNRFRFHDTGAKLEINENTFVFLFMEIASWYRDIEVAILWSLRLHFTFFFTGLNAQVRSLLEARSLDGHVYINLCVTAACTMCISTWRDTVKVDIATEAEPSGVMFTLSFGTLHFGGTVGLAYCTTAARGHSQWNMAHTDTHTGGREGFIYKIRSMRYL